MSKDSAFTVARRGPVPVTTFNDLVALTKKLDQTFKFCIPDREDHELDIRDYELREVQGMYVLARKTHERERDSLLMPALSFAEYIYLEGCTPDFAQQLVAAFPHLEKKG